MDFEYHLRDRESRRQLRKWVKFDDETHKIILDPTYGLGADYPHYLVTVNSCSQCVTESPWNIETYNQIKKICEIMIFYDDATISKFLSLIEYEFYVLGAEFTLKSLDTDKPLEISKQPYYPNGHPYVRLAAVLIWIGTWRNHKLGDLEAIYHLAFVKQYLQNYNSVDKDGYSYNNSINDDWRQWLRSDDREGVIIKD